MADLDDFSIKDNRLDYLKLTGLVGSLKHSKTHYEKIALEVAQMVAEKNVAYGNAFAKAGDFLALLYPDGIKPNQYQDMLMICRIFDKLMRIANKKDAFDENPYKDIIGYGILGASEDVR